MVTFKTTTAAILEKFYQVPKETNSETQKLRIIETSSRLIKNYIKLSVTPGRSAVFPEAEDISDLEQNLAFIPM